MKEREKNLRNLRSVPLLIGDEITPETYRDIHPFSNAHVPVEPKVIIDHPELVKPGLRLGDWSQVRE